MVKESEDPVTLLPTGPLTNIALALMKAPEIKENIGDYPYGRWNLRELDANG